ncbi:MAG: SDR family oxidoreductase [Propionibacteriales bacterium]|nr:SDR family oxidoreductase [Propionibacteriales bacterium]
MGNPVIVVVGAGAGIGAAVARRFGQEGYDAALIARSPGKLQQLGQLLQAEGITATWAPADVTDDDAVTAAIERFGQHGGSIRHLHFNPSAFTAKDALELGVEELLNDVRLGVASLLTAVRAARPFMSAGARVTSTGGGTADRPWPQAASLGVQKAALRNLVMSLDAALAPDDIRAMSLTVAGNIKDGTPFDPTYIADAIYQASQTDSEFWVNEVRFIGRH